MKRWIGVFVVAAMYAIAAGRGTEVVAQWVPRPTPTPRPIVTPPPPPQPTATPRPIVTATPRPVVTPPSTPPPVVTATPIPSTTPPARTPLIRLYPAPLLVAKPLIGGTLTCGTLFVPLGCAFGGPVEAEFIHAEGDTPAVYHFVRVR